MKQKRKLAKSSQVAILKSEKFRDKYTSWSSPVTAPSELFSQTPASIIGCTLATESRDGYLSGSVITIRACTHDGILHLNEDLLWFYESTCGHVIREKIDSPVHRHPNSGSYVGPLTWEAVHHYFGIPSKAKGNVDIFLNKRKKIVSSSLG